MKVTLAFLLFGTCLALTNAKAIKKPVHEIESVTHARMMTMPLNRWREWQECANNCSPIERSCKLRAMVSDCSLIMRTMSSDLGVGLRKLLSVKTDLQISIIVKFVEANDHEGMAAYLEKNYLVNKFMELMCVIMKSSTDEAGLNMPNILGDVMGDNLGKLCKLFPAVVGGVLGITSEVIAGLVKTATDIFGGLTDVAGNILGGVTGSLGGLTGGLGGLTDVAGNLLGGVTGSLGGLTGGLGGVTDVAGNLLGGVTGGLGGLTGGLSGLTGGLTDTLGGVTGGLGGLTGGIGNVAGSVGGLTGSLTGALGGLTGGGGKKGLLG